MLGGVHSGTTALELSLSSLIAEAVVVVFHKSLTKTGSVAGSSYP